MLPEGLNSHSIIWKNVNPNSNIFTAKLGSSNIVFSRLRDRDQEVDFLSSVSTVNGFW